VDKGRSIFISAGEQSGDMHGSSLMHELNKLAPVTFYGLGGDMMAAEGLVTLAHINDLAATGIKEVAKKYFYFKSVLKKCVNKIYEIDPPAVVLIDYPGFNLRLAKEIRENYNGKIIYYISPQVWAWHEKRVLMIKKLIDKMIVVFPFEVEFYKQYEIEAEYAGHPLVKRIGDFLKTTVKNPDAVIPEVQKLITLLPGSRNDEVKHHLPVLIDTIKMLRKDFKIKLFISRAQTVKKELLKGILKEENEFEIIESNLYQHIYESDLVMTKAGTSTMECSLIGTPFLLFYKTYPLNYYMLKPLVKISNIGIINILSGKNLVREFIQKDFNKESLYREAKKILTDKDYQKELRESLKSVWNILGTEDSAYNAAKSIYQFALS